MDEPLHARVGWSIHFDKALVRGVRRCAVDVPHVMTRRGARPCTRPRARPVHECLTTIVVDVHWGDAAKKPTTRFVRKGCSNDARSHLERSAEPFPPCGIA